MAGPPRSARARATLRRCRLVDGRDPGRDGGASAGLVPRVAGGHLVAIASLEMNPHQPRKTIQEEPLQELAASIRDNGVLQPVLVRRNGSGLELVAGERRVRAAQLAGLQEIPAIICSYAEGESMKVALLENIQREDLNAIEEAEAYRAVMERLGATHQELAGLLGKSRSAVSNMLRLLNLEQTIRNLVTGGELTLNGLDLVFDDVNKFYEAPFQVKANGGILLIDDFGRQMVRPRDLLNRWIVPLENRIDYLTLHTGRKVEVPFNVLVVFSTNLPPKDLVDEAFLRRLRHKIEIGDPSYEEYREIFRRVADNKGVKYNDQGLGYLLQDWYVKRGRKLRASHPRDICDQIIDIASFMSYEPEMSTELIQRAAEAYFVEL